MKIRKSEYSTILYEGAINSNREGDQFKAYKHNMATYHSYSWCCVWALI